MKNREQVIMPLNINQHLEFIYDQYAPVMYDIAMQMSSGGKEAEQIVFCTFKKIFEHKLLEKNPALSCVRLIKLTIETTYELFPEYKRNPIQLKQFHRSPMLNRLFCQNMDIKTFSNQNHISNSQSMQTLKMELSLLLNIKKKYLIRIVTIPA